LLHHNFSLILTANDGGTLLRSSIWNEILELDEIMKNTTISWKGQEFKYKNLCAQWGNDCFENRFLDFASLIPEIENGSFRIAYPIMFNPINFEVYILPLHFGGFELNRDSDTVLGIKAVTLNYIIAVDSPDQDLRYF